MASLTEILQLDTESETLDFKESFDCQSNAEWCELIKDIVAFANSGGGTILVGIDDRGTPVGFDITSLAALDPATVTDKIYKYTDVHFSHFNLIVAIKNTVPVFAIEISASRTPIVFAKTGNYVTENNRQRNAFVAGTVYFRHGAKSEPGTTDDLRLFLEREIERVKDSWLGGIRKVVEAPVGSRVVVLQEIGVNNLPPPSDPIHIVSSPQAGAKEVLDPDVVYPYRQADVVRHFGERQSEKKITTHDLLCIRRLHSVDTDPQFSYKGKYGSRQYSVAFIDWLVQQYAKDSTFFEQAKEAYRNPTGVPLQALEAPVLVKGAGRGSR
jgi:hypothetical protein